MCVLIGRYMDRRMPVDAVIPSMHADYSVWGKETVCERMIHPAVRDLIYDGLTE